MIDRQRKIHTCIQRAIDQFNFRDRYLIEKDLSERCICAKFASHLERVLEHSDFHDYDVDVEYNRGYKGNEYAAKRLDSIPASAGKSKRIIVDLIVHKRGFDENYGFDNLICIEMKKAYKKPDLSNDKERLRIMTDPSYGFRYQAGYMIVATADRKQGRFALEVESTYHAGHCINEQEFR